MQYTPNTSLDAGQDILLTYKFSLKMSCIKKTVVSSLLMPFKGGRTLVEYEIQMEDLTITSENRLSRGIVKIVFRRRMEFHVTNTFLQTFILIGVGYMSLFFAVDNFTDRIMVALTTMLVVATIMSSIQAVIILITS